MESVTIKKDVLMTKVKENREKHRELFLKAQEGYREDVILELDRMLADARSGKKIKYILSLPEPIDHTRDYDRVIEMLKVSVHEDIVLTSKEFENYYMDNWEWKDFVFATNSRYIK